MFPHKHSSHSKYSAQTVLGFTLHNDARWHENMSCLTANMEDRDVGINSSLTEMLKACA